MNGFLDREGKLHGCSIYGHLDKAWDIVEEMGQKCKNRLDAEQYLQHLGWVVVRNDDVYGLIGYYIKGEEKLHLTEAQMAWLNSAFEKVNSSCQKSIIELFEWNK